MGMSPLMAVFGILAYSAPVDNLNSSFQNQMIFKSIHHY